MSFKINFSKLVLCFFVVFMFSSFGSIFCEAMNQDLLLKNLQQKGQSVDCLQLSFIQKIENQELRDESRGQIFFKSPNKFRINYDATNVTYFFNGSVLKVYDKIRKQVVIKYDANLTNEKDFFGKELIGFFKFDRAFFDRYKVESYWEEKDAYAISVKDVTTTNDKVKLFIDKKAFVPKKIVWEKDYVKFFVEISDLKFDTKIDDSVFEFDVKSVKDLKVVEV